MNKWWWNEGKRQEKDLKIDKDDNGSNNIKDILALLNNENEK